MHCSRPPGNPARVRPRRQLQMHRRLCIVRLLRPSMWWASHLWPAACITGCTAASTPAGPHRHVTDGAHGAPACVGGGSPAAQQLPSWVLQIRLDTSAELERSPPLAGPLLVLCDSVSNAWRLQAPKTPLLAAAQALREPSPPCCSCVSPCNTLKICAGAGDPSGGG